MLVKLYATTNVVPMPKGDFPNKKRLGKLFGVMLVWKYKKDAREYYKSMGCKCPPMETRIADIAIFKLERSRNETKIQNNVSKQKRLAGSNKTSNMARRTHVS